MGVVVSFLAAVCAGLLWAFFKFPPSYGTPKQIRVFNFSVLGAGAMVSLAWVANIGTLLVGRAFEKYMLSFSVGGVFGIMSVFLAVFFVLRNFWIFKPRRHPF